MTDFECGMCGRDGGPVTACNDCRGAERFRQPKAATLSEYRSGRTPLPERDVQPKTHDPNWQGHNPNG